MFLKRHVPLFIVVIIGLLTLFGNFIDNDEVQNFVDNDATQWFDIIASFAIFLGALNMLKLQMLKIIRKQNNWQYSALAVLGFAVAIFAGFFYRGANYIVVSNVNEINLLPIAELLTDELHLENKNTVMSNISDAKDGYEIPKIFMTQSGAEAFMEKLDKFDVNMEIKSKKWGVHFQAKGSLFSWIFFNIFTPLSSTMFALLAFFVASASYRAFRIRNFEATLLLVSGIILMLGRVPIGSKISSWFIFYILILGIGIVINTFISSRTILFIWIGLFWCSFYFSF